MFCFRFVPEAPNRTFSPFAPACRARLLSRTEGRSFETTDRVSRRPARRADTPAPLPSARPGGGEWASRQGQTPLVAAEAATAPARAGRLGRAAREDAGAREAAGGAQAASRARLTAAGPSHGARRGDGVLARSRSTGAPKIPSTSSPLLARHAWSGTCLFFSLARHVFFPTVFSSFYFLFLLFFFNLLIFLLNIYLFLYLSLTTLVRIN